jgi:hypothetical protein
MKRIVLFLIAVCLLTTGIARNPGKSGIYKAQLRPVATGLNVTNELPSLNAPLKLPSEVSSPLDVLKYSISSSLNANGIFDYDERYLTIIPTQNMFAFGNRAGGPFGNTGNDLKLTFSYDQGVTHDSVVILSSSGKLFRYPSMVTFPLIITDKPGTINTPSNTFGIFSGPINDGTNWIDQYYGSVRLDGTNLDVNYVPNGPNVYLNHMNIGLYCSPQGNVTVASSLLKGSSSSYTQHGFNILNGTFNLSSSKFDWLPFDSLVPLVKSNGRTDAVDLAWSPDGNVGYFVFTAIDSNLTYNPYGVEWPIIYKSTDHGLTWTKQPPFDFSTIGMLHGKLFSTLADTSKVIPRWFNKWNDARNAGQNGVVVDHFGNLHIFSYLIGTLSLNPDSLNYFYTNEPKLLFDVYMTNYGSWNAIYVDSLQAVDVQSPPSSYGIGWDHQMQMSRTPDGSKVFCVWTDTDPIFATDNSAPDIKGLGFDVVNMLVTPVKDFTAGGAYWGENYWMRLATDVFYDGTTSTLPVTTSIPGATSSDPLTHQYVTGMTIPNSDFGIFVGIPSNGSQSSNTLVSGNYPNPFTGTSEFTVNLPNAANVNLVITSVVGQQVKTVDYGSLDQGVHTLTINAANLSSSVYFYTVMINDKSYTHKMVVK